MLAPSTAACPAFAPLTMLVREAALPEILTIELLLMPPPPELINADAGIAVARITADRVIDVFVWFIVLVR